jgi:hypothetical protein
MRKLLVVSVMLAATLFVAGTSLAAKAPAKSLPCKTVKFKVTRQVWNAKHTKRITVDVYKLVNETVEVKGKKKVELVKEQVYKTEKVCTAATSVTAPPTTVPADVSTPAPISPVPVSTSVPAAPTTTTVSSTTTTSTTVPSTTTTTTTTTTVPSTTTTTVPAPSPIITETTQAPVNTSYPAGTGCGGSVSCLTPNETVFSVVIAAADADVSPGAARVKFVFDAPVTGTTSMYPYEFDQFTLTTTEAGQTACPLTWVASEQALTGWFQSNPESIATDGLPACTFSSVYLYDELIGADSLCMPLDIPDVSDTSITDVTCPNAPTDMYEPNLGYYFIGAALTWEVTADFIGEGAYASSSSADQDLTVGPAGT